MADNQGPKEMVPGKDVPIGMLTRAEAVGILIESRREHSRQQYDWFKHQTTLSTGSILVVLGLVGSVLGFERFEWLLVISLVCLVLSTLLAFFAMFWTFRAGRSEELFLVDDAISMHEADQQATDQQATDQQATVGLDFIASRQHLAAFVLGVLGALIFLASIGIFILFALLNLLAPTP